MEGKLLSLLLDHGRAASEPSPLIRPMAPRLWDRSAGDLCDEAAAEKLIPMEIGSFLICRVFVYDCGRSTKSTNPSSAPIGAELGFVLFRIFGHLFSALYIKYTEPVGSERI